MAMRELPKLTRDRDDDDEVWVKHYSSNHQILLVGEGDFSFSHSLATLFGSASNICASSLDSYDDVVRKYRKARSNLDNLKRLGAFLLHGVDATTLHFHPDLRCRRFDRVIYNFPHAGFHGNESDPCQIRKHRDLVLGFFHGASRMLRANGEVHVSHKNNAPFCHWNLEELASRCFLVLIQCVAFEKSDYPGYENKRGDGFRCDRPFPLGECSTFKFRLSRVAKELYAEKVRSRELKEQESTSAQAFSNKQPVSFGHGYPLQTEFQGMSQRPVSFDLSYRRDNNLRQVQEFQGISQRPVSFDLSYRRENSLRQVQDPLVQSRQRISPLELCYYQERSCSQFEDAQFALEKNHVRFQDNSIQLEKLRYTERSSLLGQDFHFQTIHHRQEQFQESSNRLNGVSLDIYDGIVRRMLKGTRFPHLYTGESPERCRRLYQDFPVQASQEPFFERSNRFSGVSHGIYDGDIRETLTFTSFPHIGESQERTFSRQSNLNIQPPQHW